MTDSKKALKIITRKIRKSLKNPSKNFTVYWSPDQPLECYYWFHLENGVYSNINPIMHVNFKGPYGYFPFHPPAVKFITPPYHTNVYVGGSICVDIFTNESKWSPENGIDTIAANIILLFNDQNTSSPANIKAGKLFKKCMNEWVEHKKKYKKTYKKVAPPHDQDEFFASFKRTSFIEFQRYDLSKYYGMFPELEKKINIVKKP